MARPTQGARAAAIGRRNGVPREAIYLEAERVLMGKPKGKEIRDVDNLTGKRPPIIVIAPSKYVQGLGAMEDLHVYLEGLGTRATVITSETSWKRVGERINESAEKGGFEVNTFFFNGESSRSQIEGAEKVVGETNSDIVIGLGGGKAIDTAKSAAAHTGAKCAILPTIASTDAPTSALSVIYTDDGDVESYEFHRKNPDLVLMDSEVIARAPVRYLISGMADALATRWEGKAAAAAGTIAVSGGRPSNAALALGELAWDNCRNYGSAAIRAVKANAVTPAVEVIIETNTYHSGIGFESGGFSGAHSVHNGLTALPETHSMMHGEKVSFGLLVQMILENRTARELDEYIEFAAEVGLPVTLAGINVQDLSEERLQKTAELVVKEGETIHWMPFPVTQDMVAGAIVGADAYARAFFEENGLPEPAPESGAGANGDGSHGADRVPSGPAAPTG